MNAFLESLQLWLVDFFVLTSVLLAASLSVRLVVRGPAARVSLVWGTWLGIAAIAVLTALPNWPRVAIKDVAQAIAEPVDTKPIPQPAANLAPVDLPMGVFALADPIEVTPSDVVAAAFMEQPQETPTVVLPGSVVAVGAWLVTVALGLGWVLVGHWRTRRLLAKVNAAPAWVHDEFRQVSGQSEKQIQQKATKEAKKRDLSFPSLSLFPSVSKRFGARFPGLWSSDRVTSAVAMGTRLPQIVLPAASVAEDNRPAVRAALAHEWAHIRHGDLWLLALERTLLPLVAVHPLFWWLRRSVRLDQELLADAAAAGEEPVAYAEALLAWAKVAQLSTRKPARHGLAAVGMWENPSTLSRRVAMLVDSKRPLARPLGRGWAAMFACSLAALVLGLSLVSLRPLPAQEDAAPAASPDTIIEVAPRLPARSYREVPGPVPLTATRYPTKPVTQIHMNVLIMSVDRAKLAGAETSLEDEIAAATDSRCRKEAGLVVSDIQPEEVVKLLEGLKKHEAVKIVSRPQIVTLDGREAMVHVGGEAPILRVEETINGKHEERIEYKEFGTILMLRPKLDASEKEEFVQLEIIAEQSTLIPPGEKAGAFEKEPGAAPRDLPGLVSHKFKLTSDVKLGGSLLVAESPPNKKHLRDAVQQQFLLIVTPQRAVREAAAVYASPAEGEKGEAARKEAEAALEAATAAEPEPGTAAAALLKRERDLRAKETAELRKQIEALTSDLQKLRAVIEPKIVTREHVLKHRKSADVAAELAELLDNSVDKDRFKVTVDAGRNSIIVQLELQDAYRMQNVIEALDRSALPDDPNRRDDFGAEIRRKLETLRKHRASGGGSNLASVPKPATSPDSAPSAVETQLLELDLAQAKLEVEKAEKDLARIQQLAANKQISQVELDAARYALAAAQIQMRKAATKLEGGAATTASPATAPRAARETASPSSATEIKLLELDLAEAKLDLEDANQQLARVSEIAKHSPGSVTEQEVRMQQLRVERAKIQIQRIMVKLEGAQEGAARRR